MKFEVGQYYIVDGCKEKLIHIFKDESLVFIKDEFDNYSRHPHNYTRHLYKGHQITDSITKWIEPSVKKIKFYSQALYRNSEGNLAVTEMLFTTHEWARKHLGKQFVRWPLDINIPMIEVEE